MASLSSHWSNRCRSASPSARRLPIVYFSKHLQWLDWEPMAETAAELGFDGIDLTVRQGGHVEPERVQDDLPKVAKIVRNAGLDIPMITAGIVDADSPHAEDIIRTASEVGFPAIAGVGSPGQIIRRYPISRISTPVFERPSGLLINVPARACPIEEAGGRTLAALNEKYKVCAMYHNHSGSMVGASVWDLWVLIKDFDPRWVSSNFDIGHATVEGGLGGWVNSTRLMAPFMRGVAIKDFKWGKNAKGEWEPMWCPLGRGNGELPSVFRHAQGGRVLRACAVAHRISSRWSGERRQNAYNGQGASPCDDP